MFGALFGLFCYATFDLTSLALLKHWSWAVAAVDITWGAIVTAVSSTAGLVVANWLAPQADRHCERSEAIQLSHGDSGLLRRCAPRNDG
jgi:hypothetical protein